MTKVTGHITTTKETYATNNSIQQGKMTYQQQSHTLENITSEEGEQNP